MKDYFQPFIPGIEQWIDQCLPTEPKPSTSNSPDEKVEGNTDTKNDSVSQNLESESEEPGE